MGSLCTGAPVVVVQLLTRVQLFVTPWTAAHQASQSSTLCWSLLKLTSIELVMPSNHLILCHPLLILPSIFPSIRVFSSESPLCIRWHSHEIKRCLLLGRKAMTNLDSILKGRDITLPTKVHRVKAIVFKVVVYGCDRCHSVHLAKSFQELHQSFKFFYPIFLPPFFFHTHQACIIGPLSPPTPAKPEGLTGSSCPTCNYTWALLSRRVSPDTVSFHHSTDKDTGIQKLNIMP